MWKKLKRRSFFGVLLGMCAGFLPKKTEAEVVTVTHGTRSVTLDEVKEAFDSCYYSVAVIMKGHRQGRPFERSLRKGAKPVKGHPGLYHIDLTAEDMTDVEVVHCLPGPWWNDHCKSVSFLYCSSLPNTAPFLTQYQVL